MNRKTIKLSGDNRKAIEFIKRFIDHKKQVKESIFQSLKTPDYKIKGYIVNEGTDQ